jgi:cytochrome c-type biogenesis protein CcmF
MLHSVRDDLYLVVGTINPQTKLASLQVHINPLVGWIWFGCIILICGSFVCMFPEFQEEESKAWRVARGTAAITASILLGLLLALMPSPAFAQGTSSLHSGTVKIENEKEKEVFGALRCMCGTCARDLLSTCGCGEADEMREKLRAKIAAGATKDQIVAEYAKEFGSESLAIPPNTGAMKAIYVVPLTVIGGGAVGLALMLRRWRSHDVPEAATNEKVELASNDTAKKSKKKNDARDAYDARLDEELRDLDDE